MMNCAVTCPHENPGFQEPFCTIGFRQAAKLFLPPRISLSGGVAAADTLLCFSM